MRARFRLLRDAPASGPWNMGVDEALLASVVEGAGPTLRLYAWSGPWLSLGYAQSLAPERARACREAGVGVVRRSTGGRAVLHGADLTYALAAPEHALPPGLRASYDLVAGALVAALRALGVAAERSPSTASRSGRDVFDCFAVAAPDEIQVAGRKLSGSAQRRVAGALLQHGSLRLAPDPPAAAAAVGLASGVSTSLAELGVSHSRERVAATVTDALAAALDARFEPGALTDAERARAARRRARSPAAGRPVISRGSSDSR